MDFIKGLIDSDGEEQQPATTAAPPGVPRREGSSGKRNSGKRAPSTEGIPRRINKVVPAHHDEYFPEEEDQFPPPRPKSRAVVLPSGLVIGSDEEDEGGELDGQVFIEDAEAGFAPAARKISRVVRTLGSTGRRSSVMAINRSASEPAGMRLVSLPERRTLRRAEKVGATERK